jgi:hypothetical protein
VAKPRTSFFRRMTHPLRTLRDLAGEGLDRAADKARQGLHNMRHRYNGFKTRQEMNARFLRDHGGYWQGKAGKAMRRKLGREQDLARRHSRGYRESHGLSDHRGRVTDKGRSRPDLPARPRLKDLRAQKNHHRDHEKADRSDLRAKSLRDKGKHERANRHEQRARDLRGKWPQLRQPAPKPPGRVPSPHPAPKGRPDRADGRPARDNGRAPEPARLPLRPAGRLAPQPNGHAPDRTPDRTPARTTRTT